MKVDSLSDKPTMRYHKTVDSLSSTVHFGIFQLIALVLQPVSLMLWFTLNSYHQLHLQLQ